MTAVTARPDPAAPPRPVRARARRRLGRARGLLGVVPFFAYVLIFLAIPTLVVIIGAFGGPRGRPTIANLAALRSGYILDAFARSILLSASTAVLGAVFG